MKKSLSKQEPLLEQSIIIIKIIIICGDKEETINDIISECSKYKTNGLEVTNTDKLKFEKYEEPKTVLNQVLIMTKL